MARHGKQKGKTNHKHSEGGKDCVSCGKDAGGRGKKNAYEAEPKRKVRREGKR